MKSYLAAAFIALLVAACNSSPQDAPGKALLIENVVVVSPHIDEPSELTSVFVRDGRIVEIGQELSRGVDDSVQVFDGKGQFLIPGLIDGHTHLSEIPGMTFEHETKYPDIARVAHRQIPRSFLFHGFTTVVDLNARPDVVKAWNDTDLRPQAHFCGAAPVVDGYPMRFMPQPLRYKIMPYFLFDALRAEEFPEGFEPEGHTPGAIAARIHGDGGICVKTHYEPGFGGRGDWPVPTEELIQELVAAAHEKGMPVLLHANSQAAQSFGLAAGVDAFAHGMWTWNDRTATELNPDVTEVLDAAIQNGIAVQSTVQVLYGERDLHDPDYLSGDALRVVLPQSLIDWYSTEDGQWWRNRTSESPYMKELLETGRWHEVDAEPIARVTAALSYLAANGGHLIFGSDTPSDPTYSNPPGLNGRLEMDRWLAAGVTPAQIFKAATIYNANFFGLQDNVGTVEPGKRADLLLTRVNPLQDVAAYDEIAFVIVNGEVFPRSELAATAGN